MKWICKKWSEFVAFVSSLFNKKGDLQHRPGGSGNEIETPENGRSNGKLGEEPY